MRAASRIPSQSLPYPEVFRRGLSLRGKRLLNLPLFAFSPGFAARGPRPVAKQLFKSFGASQNVICGYKSPSLREKKTVSARFISPASIKSRSPFEGFTPVRMIPAARIQYSGLETPVL